MFSLSQIPKTVQLSTGKNSAKCNALSSYIECVNAFAVIFADLQREGYKLYSLLGSVGKRAETNFNFPAPLFNHISGICKNLADTWPAATRVLSRGPWERGCLWSPAWWRWKKCRAKKIMLVIYHLFCGGAMSGEVEVFVFFSTPTKQNIFAYTGKRFSKIFSTCPH